MAVAWEPGAVHPERRPADEAESLSASRQGWDAYADEYQATHGRFLGDEGFLWGPEGLTEDNANALGEVAGRDVLEIGSGAGQCSRWVLRHGGRPIGLDVSMRQLQHSRRIDDECGTVVPGVCATGGRLPFAPASFDIVFSAFGSLQFLADEHAVVGEVARVLRPGGRFVFSITHPTRWMFPDDPTEAGLTATASYWDRTPYVEVGEDGHAAYVEHHRTLGDWVRALSGAGFVLLDLVEPEWPEDHDRDWGGWSRTRGLLTPGTAIYVSEVGGFL